LQWIGVNVQIEGNMMLLNGATFTVDEACMGLNMLAISMLMGIFILAHMSRTLNKIVKSTYLIAFFAIGFLLNIITNLFRIILLVLFKIAPENPMHEIVGLLCMIVYIVIPLFLLGQWLVVKYGHEPASAKRNLPFITTFAKGAIILVSFGLMAVGIRIDHSRSQSTFSHAKVNAPGYTVTEMDDGVTKLVNPATLLYVKPIPEFFSGEHTPLLCWKGSGYTFKNTQKETISGHEIYYGQLIKNEEVLYTAWWYDNGTIQTIDQFNWRIRMMRGEEKFSLINVTAADENTLKKNIQSIFEYQLLQIQY
jgi:exosortase N